MSYILLCLENNTNDCVSALAYISQFRSSFLLPNEFERLCLVTYNCLETAHSKNIVEYILTHTKNVEKHNYIIVEDSKIHISDQWFFKLILLASLRNCKEVLNKKNIIITVEHIETIVQESLLIFEPNKIESIHILRVIENIVKKNKSKIHSGLALKLLIFSEKVAILPLEGYKHYAHSISKIALPLLKSHDLKIFLDLDLLPIKGIETLELVPYFKRTSINIECARKIVEKVIKMFSNNIENREGGFLYTSVLFEDFSIWKEVVWPLFHDKFQIIDFEGEFFQSLTKYWIPHCVSAYKLEFYAFVSKIPISNYLKGHVLLETRRKGFFEDYNEDMLELLETLFSEDSTSNLALKIVSSYFKKTLYPSDLELRLVNSYICGKTDVFDSDELKSLNRFLSQIDIVGSELLNLEDRNHMQERQFEFYRKYVSSLFEFSLKLLKTSRRNIAAQILVLLINSDSPYILNYKILRDSPRFFCNILPQKETYSKLVEETLLEFDGYCIESVKLGQLVLSHSKLYTNEYLMKFIHESTKVVSIKATESVKMMASIIVFQNDVQKNDVLLQNLFDSIRKNFGTCLPSLSSIFKGVLLFEALLEVTKYEHSQGPIFVEFDMYCVPFIENILQNDVVGRIYQQELKQADLNSGDRIHNILSKIQKLVEALINNILQFILQNSGIWTFLDKTKLMNLLINIIEISNMRRPTTLSADVLKHIAVLIDKEDQRDGINTNVDIVRKNENACFKIQLLHSTLQKLSEAPSIQNLTIRRNPESRLIIHALCSSDLHPQKPLLVATVRHLLKILSDPNSTDSTVSSAFHCTEVLISDNTLYNHTMRYVPEVIEQCVQHFESRNWIVRNANIQLARALIDRFLGILIGHNNRPKSVQDLFDIFPQLATLFCQTLIQRPLTDSSLMVMQFFSESQVRKRPIESEFVTKTREGFLKLFMMVIKENSDHYGSFGVRAFTSLCLEDEIPNVIIEVTDFIIENFSYIKANNTTANFILLLQELYDKYEGYIGAFSIKSRDYYDIHTGFKRLSVFLKQYNLKQFDLLLLKVLSTDDVVETFKLSKFQISEYTHRLWQHNYIPFLIINTDADSLTEVLKEIVSKDVLDCIQVKILSILVDRHAKKQFNSECLQQISLALVHKLLTIKNDQNYLLLCYFKVIFLFLKYIRNPKIDQYSLKVIRCQCKEVNNIYKKFVFILLLAKVDGQNNENKEFIKSTIKNCQNLDLENLELAETVSEMLPYLYINSFCGCDRYILFKIAVFLILEHGLWDFVSFITKSKMSSALFALVKILDFNVLSESFDSYKLAYRFIKELYAFVSLHSADKNSRVNNKTYYVEEKQIFVDRSCIDKIILQFLYNLKKKEIQTDFVPKKQFKVEIKNDGSR